MGTSAVSTHSVLAVGVRARWVSPFFAWSDLLPDDLVLPGPPRSRSRRRPRPRRHHRHQTTEMRAGHRGFGPHRVSIEFRIRGSSCPFGLPFDYSFLAKGRRVAFPRLSILENYGLSPNAAPVHLRWHGCGRPTLFLVSPGNPGPSPNTQYLLDLVRLGHSVQPRRLPPTFEHDVSRVKLPFEPRVPRRPVPALANDRMPETNPD